MSSLDLNRIRIQHNMDKEPQALPTAHKDDFAKIFRHPSGKQILVIADTNSQGDPSIQFMVKPDGLGVCCSAVSYTDNDEGWDLRDEKFSALNEREAAEYADIIFTMLDTVDES